MKNAAGHVVEVRQALPGDGPDSLFQVYIACPPGVVPRPGQYVLAHAPVPAHGAGPGPEPLEEALFPGALAWEALPARHPAGFWAAPPVPAGWVPGTRLALDGPRGVGFQLLPGCRRLGVAAFGAHAARVEPLVRQALAEGCDVALFVKESSLSGLPPEVEVHPLAELPEALGWMDLLALDLPLEDLGRLRSWLGAGPTRQLRCPAQALVHTALPCGGVGECGVCAAPGRRGWILPCVDGPVIDLARLDW